MAYENRIVRVIIGAIIVGLLIFIVLGFITLDSIKVLNITTPIPYCVSCVGCADGCNKTDHIGLGVVLIGIGFLICCLDLLGGSILEKLFDYYEKTEDFKVREEKLTKRVDQIMKQLKE